jgi:uncharacterized membrane protein YidH (DUF202 family)
LWYSRFKELVLACGDSLQILRKESSSQTVIYTTRTFPEQVITPCSRSNRRCKMTDRTKAVLTIVGIAVASFVFAYLLRRNTHSAAFIETTLGTALVVMVFPLLAAGGIYAFSKKKKGPEEGTKLFRTVALIAWVGLAVILTVVNR